MEMDAEREVQRLRETARTVRKRRYSHSRLDRYKAELLALQAAGGRPVDLQRWLRERRIKVVHSTVVRWLEKHGQVRPS